MVDALLRAKAKAIQEHRNLHKAEMIQVLDTCLAELWKQLPAHKKKKPLPGGIHAITEDWLQSLRDDPANAGLDVDNELQKCRLWTMGRPGQKLTRMRFINWLIKADRAVPMHSPGKARQKALTEPVGWKAWVNETYPDSIYAKGRDCEHYSWAMLPADYQAKFAKEMQE